MTAHNIAKKPAIPYRGFILYHGVEFSIIDHFAASGYKYAYYSNDKKGFFWHAQNLTASAPDHRAHSEAFPPLWLQIGETTISHYAGPNINGFVEYVAYSVGGEFFQVEKLTAQ
jgi:hypothetical protein